MSTQDNNPKDSVWVGLLPINGDWSTLEKPHMTLVYGGVVSDYKPFDFNTLAKVVASVAMLSRPFTLTVMGVDRMGPPEDLVSALILRPTPELMAMRSFFDGWNKSEFPFRPHAAIGSYPAPTSVAPPPTQVAFNKMMVCWGESDLTFNLNRSL